MKNSLALTFVVSTGALLLHCGAEDSNPPPVAQGQLNPPPTGNTTAPGSMPSGTAPAPVAPSSPTPDGNNNEGQPAAGAPLSPAQMPNGGMSAGGAPGMSAGGAPGMSAGGAAPMNAGGAPPVTPPPLDLVGLVGALDGHLFSVAC